MWDCLPRVKLIELQTFNFFRANSESNLQYHANFLNFFEESRNLSPLHTKVRHKKFIMNILKSFKKCFVANKISLTFMLSELGRVVRSNMAVVCWDDESFAVSFYDMGGLGFSKQFSCTFR